MNQFNDNSVVRLVQIDPDYYVMKIKFNTRVGTDLITYDGENYKIISIHGTISDDAKFLLCKLISKHHNVNKEPKKIIQDDYYYACPSCGFHMDDITDKCPRCDQKLLK